MTAPQGTEFLKDALRLIENEVKAALETAPPQWGPLHVIALVAKSAVTLASSTHHGRRAMLEIEKR